MKKLIVLALLALALLLAVSYDANAQSQNVVIDDPRGSVTICNFRPQVGSQTNVLCY